MLSPFDEYPVHQIAEPITHLASSDRDAFERYRFHGAPTDGSLLFGATLALYPARQIIDASFSVVVDGVQHAVHASARLAPGDRTLRVGPFTVEVDRPLRVVRLSVLGPVADELGIEVDLVFTGTSSPLEAARHTSRVDGPFAQDTKRFSQWGAWAGHLTVDGQRHPLEPGASLGGRARRWGTRPVGEPVGGAPLRSLPQQFAVNALVRIGDQVIDVDVAEDEHGRRTYLSARRDTTASPAGPRPDAIGVRGAPDDGTGAVPEAEPLRDAHVTVAWHPGTRRPARTQLRLSPWNDDPVEVVLSPVAAMALRGLGYQSPDWPHGSFKAESAVGRERWVVADLDPEDVHNVHGLSLCRARCGEHEGFAFLEVLAVGPHGPSELTGFVDGFGAGGRS